MYSFPYLEPVHCSMSSPNCCFFTCIQISQETGKVVCFPISWKIFQFVVIHTVKGFSVLNEAEVCVFLVCIDIKYFSFSFWLTSLCLIHNFLYLRLIHVVIWQKPTQLCKAIILQLKAKKKRKKPKSNFVHSTQNNDNKTQSCGLIL